MSQYLVSYDLEETSPNPHSKFLEIAINEKWFTFGVDDVSGDVIKLPNTTLEREFDSMQEAVRAFKRVADLTKMQGYKVNLTKVCIIEVKSERFWDNSTFILGA